MMHIFKSFLALGVALTPLMMKGADSLHTAVDSMAAHYLSEVVRTSSTDNYSNPFAQPTATSIYAYDNPANQVKRPWVAAAEAFGINVFVQCFDRFILDADFAKINLHSIHHNLKTGFVWDNDQFSTNLFAHP